MDMYKSTYVTQHGIPRPRWDDWMSQSEVFRPSNGPLFVRGNLSDGLPISSDVFRKGQDRPASQNSSRFGRLSQNSFFARHNPHPGRVRHIKGLLDVPICAVNDGGYFANPRYSMQFPPSYHDNNKLKSYSANMERLPAGSININSTMHPINTITGLQSFVGKPLNFRVFREKAVPRVGMVPVQEAWRDELRALTEAVGVSTTNLPKIENQKPKKPMTADGRPMTEGARRPMTDRGRPRTSQYSANTGRLIPPPSRAMSRQASRNGRTPCYGALEHIAAEPDMENVILQMLCQILQTDNVNAVQSWLVAAGDREKALALDMIRTAISSEDDYYKRTLDADNNQADFKEGQIIGGRSQDLTKQVDRLSLDGDQHRPCSQLEDDRMKFFGDTNLDGNPGLSTLAPLFEDDDTKPPGNNNDVFHSSKSRSGDRPMSGLQRARTPTKPSSPPVLGSEPKLRYTMTEIKDQDICSQKKSLQDVLDE